MHFNRYVTTSRCPPSVLELYVSLITQTTPFFPLKRGHIHLVLTPELPWPNQYLSSGLGLTDQVGRGNGRPVARVITWCGPPNSFWQPTHTPRSAAIQSSVQQPRAQRRAFAMTHQETKASNAVVEGMVSISGHTAHALYDPGATHSFISVCLLAN